MTLEEFKASLTSDTPPEDISAYLQALWYDGKGNWSKSHTIIENLHDSSASWVHAYLHRKEGDIGNAEYWYNKAGKQRPSSTLKQEWEDITIHQLQEFYHSR